MGSDESRLPTTIAGGRPEDVGALWDAYADRVMGFAVHLTGDRTDAEDLVQDTFVAAHSGRRSYRGRGTVLSWLLGIAARRWRDTRRARSKRPQAVSPGDPCVLERLAAPRAGHVLSVALAQELLRLPEDQREAFLLIVPQGLSYSEASTATGIRAGTLKWRVHAAMRRLRVSLFPAEESDHGLQPTMGTEADVTPAE